MAFKLRFLGTGGSFSRFEVNYHNNALLTTTDGKNILIDCGMTAPQALHEMGIKPWEIDEVAITHLHSDHAGGLEQLAWERYYTGPNGPGFRQTPVICGPGLRVPLTTYLEQSLNPFTNRYGNISDNWDPEVVNVIGKSNHCFISKQGDTTISFEECNHVTGRSLARWYDKPAYGISITERVAVGKHIDCYYSGDTTFDPVNLERKVEMFNTEMIFHECMFFPKYPGTVHTHYEELLTLPPDVRSRIVLMHYNEVPAGVDVIKDGFRAAAKRFEEFQVG